VRRCQLIDSSPMTSDTELKLTCSCHCSSHSYAPSQHDDGYKETQVNHSNTACPNLLLGVMRCELLLTMSHGISVDSRTRSLLEDISALVVAAHHRTNNALMARVGAFRLKNHIEVVLLERLTDGGLKDDASDADCIDGVNDEVCSCCGECHAPFDSDEEDDDEDEDEEGTGGGEGADEEMPEKKPEVKTGGAGTKKITTRKA
jgi:hypothetical protein